MRSKKSVDGSSGEANLTADPLKSYNAVELDLHLRKNLTAGRLNLQSAVRTPELTELKVTA